jgi:signal transduction histidine kinase
MAALLGLVVIKAALSIFGSSVPFALSYSGISYLLLLLLATAFSIRNVIHSEECARPFWALLAAGYGLWAFHQVLDLYFELVLRIEAPDNSIADEVLFLHLVPMMAAVATLPHLHVLHGRQYRWKLNTLVISAVGTFLYGFLVSPYKYFSFSPSSYGARFDILYLIESLALIAMLCAVTLRARPPWKVIYLQLLGASTLYALSSTVANNAIDAGGYVNGKIYGLGLTTSVCWFVWVPLSAQFVPKAENDIAQSSADEQDSQVSGWAMWSALLISIPMLWELFHRDENTNIRTLRLIVATAAILLLAGGAYLREYLDKRELALSFNRRLIQAQEEERVRIARELQDDIAQHLAALGIRLGQLKESPNRLSNDILNQFSRMQEDIDAIFLGVHHLSHELHSSVLEFLGLSAAIRSWCGEFGENREIDVLFESHDVPTGLPLEISLHLYRVLQEALNNAAKHSGIKRFEVRLWGTPAEIHLSVTDLGKGFNIHTAMRGRGLGLKSMRERVKLMNGQLEIESKANSGTTIHVRVPVASGNQPSEDEKSRTTWSSSLLRWPDVKSAIRK